MSLILFRIYRRLRNRLPSQSAISAARRVDRRYGKWGRMEPTQRSRGPRKSAAHELRLFAPRRR